MSYNRETQIGEQVKFSYLLLQEASLGHRNGKIGSKMDICPRAYGPVSEGA